MTNKYFDSIADMLYYERVCDAYELSQGHTALNSWELDFINDIHSRKPTKFTDKQRVCIDRIIDKLDLR